MDVLSNTFHLQRHPHRTPTRGYAINYLEIVCVVYHVNYYALQGFPALRKAVTTLTHVRKYDIFSGVLDIANQLLTRQSPFAPLSQVDE